jgi:GT2 family glycosyltransferase
MNAQLPLAQITAVVCAHNPPPVVHEVIRRLRDHGLQTIVVDDGSRPPLEIESDGDPLLQLLTCSENIGLAAARNRALVRINTEWVLFVDADVLPDDSFLTRLPRLLAESKADGVGFHVQEHYRKSDWDCYRAIERDAATASGPVEWISGLLCAHRTEAVRAVGGFDPAFRTNGEDVDLGLRLSWAGRQLIQISERCGMHHRKDSLGSFLRMHYRYALTAKRVDRSHYFASATSTLQRHPPLFYWGSIWPQLRLSLAFLRRRPWAVYLPPLVVGAMLVGAHAGRRVVKQQGQGKISPRPRMNLAVE